MGDKAFFLILVVILIGVAIYAYSSTDAQLPGNINSPSFSGAEPAESIIAKSDDNGKTFSPATIHNASNPRNLQIYDIEQTSYDGFAYAGTNEGLFISKDGGENWHQYSDLEKKLGEKTKIYSIISYPGENGRFFIAANDKNIGRIYETKDNFFSVKSLVELENTEIYSFEIYNGSLYAGLSDGRILEYLQNQSSFRTVASLGSPIDGIMAENNVIYIATKNRGILASYDNWSNFSQVSVNGNYGYGDAKIAGKNVVYAASLYGLAKTNDNGKNWTAINTILPKNRKINTITVDEKGNIYASSGYMVYVSRDYGYSWQTTRPFNNNERDVSVILASKNSVIVGTK